MEQTIKLTQRQQEVLDILCAYHHKHGFPPTVYEIAGLLGCRSPNAAATHLKALAKKGAITVSRSVSRGITINMPTEEDLLVCLLRSVLNGEENAREQAIKFLNSRGVRL